ncbi:unnamed protein product [Protopolystoma xenopodis]|uniref:Uncharacterized protein n=1 Tax=Protopolystoma xenopodis TaxID=117903 RepID=A0A3S5A478_9PLAT|nr:unnamed protein product [Protopolystoma xenopodis]
MMKSSEDIDGIHGESRLAPVAALLSGRVGLETADAYANPRVCGHTGEQRFAHFHGSSRKPGQFKVMNKDSERCILYWQIGTS